MRLEYSADNPADGFHYILSIRKENWTPTRQSKLREITHKLRMGDIMYWSGIQYWWMEVKIIPLFQRLSELL